MELTYVLTYFDLDEEQGRSVICAAGSNYDYLKGEAVEQSKYNTDVKYSIEFYVSTEKIKSDLTKTEVYYNGELESVYTQP